MLEVIVITKIKLIVIIIPIKKNKVKNWHKQNAYGHYQAKRYFVRARKYLKMAAYLTVMSIVSFPSTIGIWIASFHTGAFDFLHD